MWSFLEEDWCLLVLGADITQSHWNRSSLYWCSLETRRQQQQNSRLFLALCRVLTLLARGGTLTKVHKVQNHWALPTTHCSFTQLTKTLMFCHTNNTNGTSVKYTFQTSDIMYRIFRAVKQIVEWFIIQMQVFVVFFYLNDESFLLLWVPLVQPRAKHRFKVWVLFHVYSTGLKDVDDVSLTNEKHLPSIAPVWLMRGGTPVIQVLRHCKLWYQFSGFQTQVIFQK